MNWELLYEFAQNIGKPQWGKNEEIDKWIPECFVSLYQEYDPLEVELPFEGNSLNMIPYKELDSYLGEYGLDKKSLIFATCNGDPYFMNDSKIYTFVHGVENPSWELLNESVKEFFMTIINDGT
ncbi:hypothetical protein JRC49_10865 [Clostridiales bacterium FE2011]|nr:hypothetical protein JRC49_10865 [Clostridiales bacterium FE2011]